MFRFFTSQQLFLARAGPPRPRSCCLSLPINYRLCTVDCADFYRLILTQYCAGVILASCTSTTSRYAFMNARATHIRETNLGLEYVLGTGAIFERH